MCIIHLYRPSCGHYSIRESPYLIDQPIRRCGKQSPCNKPLVEIADITMPCAPCRKQAANALAVPKMHQIDPSKLKSRHKRSWTFPSYSFPSHVGPAPKQSESRPSREDSNFLTKVMSTLRGEIAAASSGLNIGLPLIHNFRQPRRTIFENPNDIGFFQIV